MRKRTRRPIPKEVRAIIALRLEVSGECYKLARAAKKNPKLKKKLIEWRDSLTKKNCHWAEYAVSQETAILGLSAFGERGE